MVQSVEVAVDVVWDQFYHGHGLWAGVDAVGEISTRHFYLLRKTLIRLGSFSCRFPVTLDSWGSSPGSGLALGKGRSCSGVVFIRVLKD